MNIIKSALKIMRRNTFHMLAVAYSLFPSRRFRKYDLVIVRGDALGDYIIWHDTLSAYIRKYEGKKVLLICADIVKTIAESDPFFTEIYSFNRTCAVKNLFYYLKVIKFLRSIETNIVLYPVRERHLIGDSFVLQVKSPIKIGFCCNRGFSIFSFFYNHIYSKLIKLDESLSEIEANELFTKDVVSGDYSYGYYPLKVDKHSKVVRGNYLVIAFSSSEEPKEWGVDNFAKIIDYIPRPYKIVLTGFGKRDVEKANYIVNHTNNRDRIINKVNKTTTIDLVHLIANSSFVIGNDSAAVHIAAATRVRSLCILLGAQFCRFLPYPERLPFAEFLPRVVYKKMDCFGCNYHCKYKDHNPYQCLKEISVEMVIREIDYLLGA